MTNNLPLPSAGFFHLPGQLVILVGQGMRQQDFKTLLHFFCHNPMPLVLSRNRDRTDSFILHLGDRRLTLFENQNSYMFNTGNSLHQVSAQKSANHLHRRLFLLYPDSTILLIYQNNSYMISAWQESHQGRTCLPFPRNLGRNMDSASYNDFLEKMQSFFEARPVQQDFKVPDRMSSLVLTPFKTYTDAELRILQLAQLKGPVHFSGLEALGNRRYRFTVSGNVSFSAGDWVRLRKNTDEPPIIVGSVSEYNKETAALILQFFFQFDHDILPKSGILELASNKQHRIRTAVLNAFRGGTVSAPHTYQTFDTFTTQPYTPSDEDLIPFLQTLLSGTTPPNQMQMETIIKGILTKDMLLVLGPPGTGKTTVIRSWVQYYLQKGHRVLISAHSNAAVDNVLERFGKYGEVVRLGNEEKVQENCRKFMPKYKTQVMQEKCRENTDRAQQLLLQDETALLQRQQAMKAYLECAQPLLDARTPLLEEAAPLEETAQQLQRLYRKYLPLRQQAEGLLQTVRKKKGYLQKNSRRNFFLRILTCVYTLFVKLTLSSTRKKLEALRPQLSQLARRYQATCKQLAQQRDELRKSNAYHRYFAAKKPLDQLCDQLFRGSSPLPALQLQSVLQSLYTPCAFRSSSFANIAICIGEHGQLQSLLDRKAKISLALQQWNAAAQSPMRNDIFQEILLNSCQIVGATTMGINANPLFAGLDFGVAILDEAGQISIHDALIPISRAPKTLMLGDFKQIPPFVHQDMKEACANFSLHLLEASFFQFLYEKFRQNCMDEEADAFPKAIENYDPADKSPARLQQMAEQVARQGYPLVSLTHQFRMPGCISDLVAPWFYDGNYYSAYDMSQFRPLIPNTKDPILVIDTSNDPNRSEQEVLKPGDESGSSYENHREAALVVSTVAALLESMDETARSSFLDEMNPGMGIITPYEPQVKLIRSMLKRRLRLTDAQAETLVNTLDSFQGQERELIFFSFVRSTVRDSENWIAPVQQRIGFMKDMRRLNVAITRAKKQLVILGDMRYLSACRFILAKDDFNYKTAPCSQDEKKDLREQAAQCATCPAVCERRLAFFVKWIISGLKPGAGQLVDSQKLEQFLKGGQL